MTARGNKGSGATRRSFLKSVAGVVGSAALGASPATPAVAEEGRELGTQPNILLMHSHDLGRFLHCYGVPTVRTPNLDRLASEGVLFERSLATAPQCSPSRASIFTGRYPHCTGVLGLTHEPFYWDLNPDELHLGQILKQAGYRTGGVGVLHETHSGPARCGLEEYAPKQRATDVADETIAMLHRFSGDPSKPFYIQAGTTEPHRIPGADLNADRDFIGTDLVPDTSEGLTVPGYLRNTPGTRAELGELQGSVHHMDTEWGRVLDALKEFHLEQNTLVIFTTDHGIALPRAKCSVYEPGQETALILRLPSRPGWHGGLRHDALISNIDYLPTILDAVHVPIPARVQGRSFAPLLNGMAYTRRDVIFYEMTYHDYYDPRRAVRTEEHKLIVNFSSAPAFMDPSGSWRPRCDTVVPPNGALAYHVSFELYGLKNDPLEQRNVSSDPVYADILRNLRGLLLRHMEQTNDPLLEGAVSDPMHSRGVKWLHA